MTEMTAYQKKMRAESWQRATWACFWLVMLTFAINTTANAPPDMALGPVVTAGMTFWLLQTLPLWLFFPAMKRHHTRALSWFGYILLLYLPFCIVGAFDPPHWSGVLTSLSVLALFFSNAFWVRALKRARAAS
ncbi:DUF2069 domain-containing protein [Natronospirillum operosum]|uniref:DUF2069 domain-containing protein n=1 Tax=Natronospirillum operosum TaxID=2759953 RepID=A0A4Z0WIW8_9GAMM|nr:DUF2069 domain-containing protein [Natronospirillum operosum]TGG95403.1 DUF2069 domain-containing protein [Natronospirillum operosum]